MSVAVLFQQFPLDDLERVTAAVSAARQIPVFDAATKIHRGWGFLERQISEEDAHEHVRSLAGQGVPTVAIAETDLRTVPDSQVMVGFDADDRGFSPRLQTPGQPTNLVPWTEIAIVAAGGFSEEIIQRDAGARTEKSGAGRMLKLGVFLATGIPVGLFGNKKQAVAPKRTTHLVTFGQIITTAGDSFFFDPDRFDFSGLGPLTQLNRSANFHALIAELARRTSARLNLGARFVLERKSLTLANYQSVHDFETELTWMLNTG
jgi:hypothetical protein